MRAMRGMARRSGPSSESSTAASAATSPMNAEPRVRIVAMAAPAMPSAGAGPRPRIRMGSSTAPLRRTRPVTRRVFACRPTHGTRRRCKVAEDERRRPDSGEIPLPNADTWVRCASRRTPSRASTVRHCHTDAEPECEDQGGANRSRRVGGTTLAVTTSGYRRQTRRQPSRPAQSASRSRTRR